MRKGLSIRIGVYPIAETGGHPSREKNTSKDKERRELEWESMGCLVSGYFSMIEE